MRVSQSELRERLRKVEEELKELRLAEKKLIVLMEQHQGKVTSARVPRGI